MLCNSVISLLIVCRRSHGAKLYLIRPNLRHIASDAIFVFVGTSVYAALNEEFVAFPDILLHKLGELAPYNDAVPIGTLGYLCSIGQGVGRIAGCQRECGHRPVGVNVSHLGVTTYVANKHCFVEGHAGRELTEFERGLSQSVSRAHQSLVKQNATTSKDIEDNANYWQQGGKVQP